MPGKWSNVREPDLEPESLWDSLVQWYYEVFLPAIRNFFGGGPPPPNRMA